MFVVIIVVMIDILISYLYSPFYSIRMSVLLLSPANFKTGVFSVLVQSLLSTIKRHKWQLDSHESIEHSSEARDACGLHSCMQRLQVQIAVYVRQRMKRNVSLAKSIDQKKAVAFRDRLARTLDDVSPFSICTRAMIIIIPAHIH